jgi:hypothetical protein
MAFLTDQQTINDLNLFGNLVERPSTRFLTGLKRGAGRHPGRNVSFPALR